MESQPTKLAIESQCVIFVSHYKNVYDNDEKLFSAFCTFGEIQIFFILPTRAGDHIAYIQYFDPADAKRAVYRLSSRDEKDPDVKIGILTGIGDSVVKLYVKNLAQCINDEELRFIFETYGKVKFAYVKTNAKNESVGFGFVTFFTAEDANRARACLNGERFYGKVLSINFCQEKHHREAYLLALKNKVIAKKGSICQTPIATCSQSFDSSSFSPKETFSIPTTPVSTKSIPNYLLETPPPLSDAVSMHDEAFSDYAMQELNIPIDLTQEDDKKIHSPFQEPFILDKALIKDTLMSKVEQECKQYVVLIVKEIMHRSTVDLNMILKYPKALKDAVKEELRGLVFD